MGAGVQPQGEGDGGAEQLGVEGVQGRARLSLGGEVEEGLMRGEGRVVVFLCLCCLLLLLWGRWGRLLLLLLDVAVLGAVRRPVDKRLPPSSPFAAGAGRGVLLLLLLLLRRRRRQGGLWRRCLGLPLAARGPGVVDGGVGAGLAQGDCVLMCGVCECGCMGAYINKGFKSSFFFVFFFFLTWRSSWATSWPPFRTASV